MEPVEETKEEQKPQEAGADEQKDEENKQEENKQESNGEVKPEPKKWKNLNNLAKQLNGLIVQKYNENPSLVHGRKYDVRYFMLIACTKPWLVMTHTGYARISLEKYSTESFSADDKKARTTHLTNAAIQKLHPDFKSQKEDTIMDMDMLREYMLKNEPDIVKTPEDFNQKVIAQCNEICRLLFESAKSKLESKFGCFELFGLDFLLDSQLNPQLIEINTNPALFTDTTP